MSLAGFFLLRSFGAFTRRDVAVAGGGVARSGCFVPPASESPGGCRGIALTLFVQYGAFNGLEELRATGERGEPCGIDPLHGCISWHTWREVWVAVLQARSSFSLMTGGTWLGTEGRDV